MIRVKGDELNGDAPRSAGRVKGGDGSLCSQALQLVAARFLSGRRFRARAERLKGFCRETLDRVWRHDHESVEVFFAQNFRRTAADLE
jgi:hypothetical protein